LADLFLYVIIMDKQMVGSKRPLHKSSVPCQDNAVVLDCAPDDLVVVEGSVVIDVEPQEPHPLRKPSQHDISDEFHKKELSRLLANEYHSFIGISSISASL
jgi:hypothetical protein